MKDCRDCRDCGYCQRNIDPRHFYKTRNGVKYGGCLDLHCALFNGYMTCYQAANCPYFTTHEDREYHEKMMKDFWFSEDSDVYIPFGRSFL